MMLADLGADVIKIEPVTGDAMRRAVGPFVGCQRGKRDIAVNLKTPEGLERVKYLLHTYQQSEERQSKDQGRMPVSYDFLWSALGIDQRRESWATAIE